MKIIRTLMLTAALLAIAAPAMAQDEGGTNPTLSRFGLRGGWTNWGSDWGDINQVHLGVHYLAGELFPNVEFTPNLEIGFGDGTTIWAFQGDLAYQFTELVQKPWGFYGGGSLAFNIVDVDGFDSQTDLGLSLIAGGKYNFSSGRQGMLEIRVGLLDSPDFKLTVGTTLF